MNTLAQEFPVEAAADAVSRLAASRDHPFVGLRPFTYEDHQYFFGRNAQIEALERALARDRLLSVIGSSGSGKSSLVRAGLLPRLQEDARKDKWDWVEMRPGESPIRHLANALSCPNVTSEARALDRLAEARTDRIELILRESSYGISEALKCSPGLGQKGLVVLVDQFEEIFRFADMRGRQSVSPDVAQEKRDEATLFVQLLLTARDDPDFNGHIVLTMRSDFIGDCARFHGLSEAITTTQYLVPSLTRDQRAEAIRGPVHRAGAEIEPLLVQRVLNDTNEDPDQLPVMQHALMRCWRHARARSATESPTTLTTADYTAIGGVERCLSLHANEILSELANESPPAGRESSLGLPIIVKRVFQSLTDTDSRGRVTRRPQSLGQLIAVLTPEDANPGDEPLIRTGVRRVVARFSDPDCSFLRAPEDQCLADESVIDIGHEALIRRWDKLGALDQRNWIREEQQDAERLYDLVRIASFGGVLPPERLPEFEAWWHSRRPNSFWALRYSRDGADILSAAKEVFERSRAAIRGAETRRKNRRVLAIAATGVVLALIGWMAISSIKQTRRDAEQTRRDAEQANMAKQRLVSVLGSYQLERETAYEALLTAIYGLDPDGDGRNAPDGRNAAARANNAAAPPVRELEALAYRALEHLHETVILRMNQVGAIAFHPDGRLFAIGGGVLTAWSLAGGDPQAAEITPVSSVFDMAMSHDGRKVLISTTGSTAKLYGTSGASGDPPKELGLPSGMRPGAGVFSPDGLHLLTSGRGSSPRLWIISADGQDYRVIKDFSGDPRLKTGQNPVAFSGDSSLFAIASEEGTALVFETNTQKFKYELKLTGDDSRQKIITGLAFNPRESNSLLVVYFANPAVLWTVREHQDHDYEKTQLSDSAGSFRAVFSPDGRYIALTSTDGAVRLYHAAHLNEPPQFLRSGGSGMMRSIAFSRTPPYQLATGTQRAIWLWDLEPALSRGLAADGGSIAASSPRADSQNLANGRDVALHQASGEFTIVSSRTDIKTARLDLPDKTDPPLAVAFSPEGEWLAWAAEKGILLFDLRRSLSPVAVLGDTAAWHTVGFASTPDRIMATDANGQRRAWRYFRSKHDLVSFARQNLPIENGTFDQLEHRSMPAHALPVALRPADRCKLAGVVRWITRAADQEGLECGEAFDQGATTVKH